MSSPSSRSSRRIAAVLVAVVLTAGWPLGAPTPARAAPPPPPPELDAVPTWAWCGVHPDDPSATAAARSMAEVAGIDATFGPCNVPSSSYTPAFTADRYVDPPTYRRLVQINAAAGMRTVVYDARIWSDQPAVRDQALADWAPLFPHIAAWDMGDEFAPDGPEWEILVERWHLVLAEVTTRSGIAPYTNHLPEATEQALDDLAEAGRLLSFVRYGDDQGEALARDLDARVDTLMCGVNAFDHMGFRPDEVTIRRHMERLRSAGCDQFLVFGGQRVYGTDLFGGDSLVDEAGAATSWAGAVMEGVGRSSYRPVGPARLLETRIAGELTTADGRYQNVGFRGAGSVTELTVAGRAGIPAFARSVVLDVTVVNARRPGYVTVYPCDGPPPNAAQVNHDAGGPADATTTAVVARVGASGRVCLFTMSDIDLAVDVTGFYPAASPFAAVSPARLLDTRVGEPYRTADGQMQGIGRREAGAVTRLPVWERAGVPRDSAAVVLTVTATGTDRAGFVTAFPCDVPIPRAATLNHSAGATTTNTTLVPVGPSGDVCFYTMGATDLVVDVGGYHRVDTSVRPLNPARLVETRTGPGLGTVDGQQHGIGQAVADGVTVVQVGGRAGVPSGARTAFLVVTVTEPAGPGFVTVFPCGAARPNAASLNVTARATATNLAVAPLSRAGTVCIYSMVRTHLVVDVLGYHP